MRGGTRVIRAERGGSPIVHPKDGEGRGFLAIRPLYEGVLTDRYPSHEAVPDGHRLAAAKYAGAFDLRARLAQAIPEAAQGMTRFAIRFPLMTVHCASVVTGLNTPEQVAEICEMAQNVVPDPATVARVRALSSPS